MYLETGRPMRGAARARLRAFLRDCGLDYDEGVSFSAALMEGELGQTMAFRELSQLIAQVFSGVESLMPEDEQDGEVRAHAI